MKNLIIFMLIFFNSSMLWAQGDKKKEKEDSSMDPIAKIMDIKDEVGKIIDYNAENKSKNGFSTHKVNYLLPVTRSNYDEERKKNEIKFQVSVKQRLLKFYGWAWFITYTQKSFWQAYDRSDSRPFRENNFNPESFIRTKMWSGWRVDLGIEHESNGQREPMSKSWNRIYLLPYFENDFMIMSLKLWYRIPEDKKEYPDDPSGDENPDIHVYYGHGELFFTLKLRELYVSTTARYNFKHYKGACMVELSYPLHVNSMYWYVQYWEGYGESLIDYNINQRKIGFGFMFTR